MKILWSLESTAIVQNMEGFNMFRKFYLPNTIYKEKEMSECSLLNHTHETHMLASSRMEHWYYQMEPAYYCSSHKYGKDIAGQHGDTRYTLLEQTLEGFTKITHHIRIG